MVTGIAYNFHKMELSTASESSQWWGPMASAVIFGLAMATVLTLVVVPTLYSLVYTGSRAAGRGVNAVRRAYWAPFHRLTGTTPGEEGQV
jgi:Cu/Ag efflux pump CusA